VCVCVCVCVSLGVNCACICLSFCLSLHVCVHARPAPLVGATPHGGQVALMIMMLPHAEGLSFCCASCFIVHSRLGSRLWPPEGFSLQFTNWFEGIPQYTTYDFQIPRAYLYYIDLLLVLISRQKLFPYPTPALSRGEYNPRSMLYDCTRRCFTVDCP